MKLLGHRRVVGEYLFPLEEEALDPTVLVKSAARLDAFYASSMSLCKLPPNNSPIEGEFCLKLSNRRSRRSSIHHAALIAPELWLADL